jgi:hypothetical protein
MEKFAIGAMAGISLVLIVGIIAGVDTAYDRGYCEALGGERINTSVCNVDGKVVEVR